MHSSSYLSFLGEAGAIFVFSRGRGRGIIVSISGREEKLRVLSSKPDGYVFDNNLNKRIHDAQRRPWGAHRTETRVAVGRVVPLKSNGSPLAGHVDLMPRRLQTRDGGGAARAENWRARPGGRPPLASGEPAREPT